MLFKHKTTVQTSSMQAPEDDFHREDNSDYEPEVYDDDETDAEQSAQTPPQRTNPFPKKNFPGSPAVATATTTTHVPTPAPATSPAPEQPVSSTTPAPVTTQAEAEQQPTSKLIQMTVKIDRVLHGRIRYASFKTGMNHGEVIEELIRKHCPEVP